MQAKRGRAEWSNISSIEATGSCYRQTPLYAASLNGREEAVRILLENGADIEAESFFGTPLFSACFNSHNEVAKLLLEHGANVNYQDREGKTTLQVANWEMRKLLKAKGAKK